MAMTDDDHNWDILLIARYVWSLPELDDEYRRLLINQVLEHRMQFTAAQRDSLNNQILDRIQIKGYRKSYQAPLPRLSLEILKEARSDNLFQMSILSLWTVVHADLEEAVKDFLAEMQWTTDQSALLRVTADNEEKLTTISRMVDSFGERHPEVDSRDALVMVALQAQSFDDDDKDKSNNELTAGPKSGEESSLDMAADQPHLGRAMSSGRWTNWLEELRALPPTAPEWAELPLFVELLHELRAGKLQELEAGRTNLHTLLTALKDLPPELITYFELEDIRAWEADSCPQEQLGESTRLADQLRGTLLRHQELSKAPRSTMAETRRLRDSLTELENQISELHSSLAAVVQPSSSGQLEAVTTAETDMAAMAQSPLTVEPVGEEATSAAPAVAPVLSASVLAPRQPGSAVNVSEGGVSPAAVVTELAPEAPLAEAPALLPNPATLSDAANQPEPVAVPPVVEQPAEPALTGPELALVPTISAPANMADMADSKPLATATVAEPLPTICDSKAVAQFLQGHASDYSHPDWYHFLWALIRDGDLPAAYWLARTLPNAPVPDWLLAAVQGARWLTPGAETFVSDLLDITTAEQPGTGAALSLLCLSAALRPALIAPYTGLIAWLKMPSACRTARGIVDAVSAFAALSLPLRPEDLQGVAGGEQCEIALKQVVRDAREWLEHAPKRKTKFSFATTAWRTLVELGPKPKGQLRDFILPVVQDQRQHLEQVKKALQEWQRRDYVLDRIPQPGGPIVGDPREQILRYTQEAVEIVRRWCSQVERQNEISRGGDWLLEQVGQLRNSVTASLPAVYAEIAELSTQAQPLELAASAECLGQSLVQLQTALQIPDGNTLIPPCSNSWDWMTVEATTLGEALSRRLLWCPELSLRNPAELDLVDMKLMPEALRQACAEGRSLSQALDLWLNKQDYRFAEIIQFGVPSDVDWSAVDQRIRDAKLHSQVQLRSEKEKTRTAVDQALLDGVIGEEESSQYGATADVVATEGVANFAAMYAQLREVRDQLNAARQNRLKELVDKWQSLIPYLDAPALVEAKERIVDFAQAAIDRADTRVLEEFLARLTSAVDSGGYLQETWFTPRSAPDILAEFLQSQERIEQWLSKPGQTIQQTAAEIKLGKTIAGLKFGEVPSARLNEAAEAMAAWSRLKQKRASDVAPVRGLLDYLGLTMNDTAVTKPKAEQGQDWVYWTLPVVLPEIDVPIPQFGSQTNGTYHVICMWERPGTDTIVNRLRELRLTQDNVVIFYLGRLSMRQRNDLLRLRERGLALALLDEILLFFLAQERDAARLSSFLLCALPYAAVNPYTPFQAGDVPPEMFFGRERMARDLLDSSGPCIVYGGRQLGKSALLRHVQRRFHHPERHQHAWIENMKLVFDPQAQKDAKNLWRVIREGFRREGLINTRSTVVDGDKIRQEILGVMQENPHLEVIVMFDESDQFLDLEADRYKFREVIGLRELMLETGRRFKVIFAGLHNVQRFQAIPDQPLAHFGTPVRVGPLEADAAEQLVRRPLEALGYRFDESAAVLRILSYTNYHPGLIQLFCQALLKAQQERGGTREPPYQIKPEDVERVYLDPDIRDRIKERLDWTLALDLHYQAIAWTMIKDQMEARDSFARSYTPREILDLAQSSWPKGFGDISLEKLQGFINELWGLGVLARGPNGYRLRSPNLVRLIGTGKELNDHLEELAGKEPPRESDANEYHALLDKESRCYSPLTYSQAGSVNASQSGVNLVFASDATGLGRLPKAFRQFTERDPGETAGQFVELPVWATSRKEIIDFLDRTCQKNTAAERLIVYSEPAHCSAAEVAELVETAIRYCDKRRARKQILRPTFVFGPAATVKWLALPAEQRQQLEDQATIQSARRWTVKSIAYRLEAADLLAAEKIVKRIHEVTSGWPFLVEEFFAECDSRRKDKDNDPTPVTEDVAARLAEADSHLRKGFLQALALAEHPKAVGVLTSLTTLNDPRIPVDFLTPEICSAPDMSQEEFDQVIEFLKRMDYIEVRNNVALCDPLALSLVKQL